MSNRAVDMKGERIVKDYLIHNFYDYLKTGKVLKGFSDYKDITDVDLQLQGIDTILYTPDNKECNIDEKCALYYINQSLPTFAFEILWHRQGIATDGWLLNNNLKTDFYFVLWLKGVPKLDKSGNYIEKADYVKQMSESDITYAELLVINRHNLHKQLASIGLTDIILKDRANKLITTGVRNFKFDDDLKLVYSPDLSEKPVNLIIKKHFLYKIASCRYEITPTQIKRNNIIVRGD